MARKWTSCRVFWNSHSLQIDIGNPYKGKIVDWLLISHTHYDHVESYPTLPAEIPVLVPSVTFIDRLLRLNPAPKVSLFTSPKNLDGLVIEAFPVFHSRTTKTYGFKLTHAVDAKKKLTMVWLPDWYAIPNQDEIFSEVNFLFLGAAAMKKPIKHEGWAKGQGAIYDKLKELSNMSDKLKKDLTIYLIHFGAALRPLKVKIPFLQRSFPNLKIEGTWDSRLIDLI